MSRQELGVFELMRGRYANPQRLVATFCGSNRAEQAAARVPQIANAHHNRPTEPYRYTSLPAATLTTVDGRPVARIPYGERVVPKPGTGGRDLRLQIMPRLIFVSPFDLNPPADADSPVLPPGARWVNSAQNANGDDQFAQDPEQVQADLDAQATRQTAPLYLLVSRCPEPEGPFMTVLETYTRSKDAQVGLRGMSGWFEQQWKITARWSGTGTAPVALLPQTTDTRHGEVVLPHLLTVIEITRPTDPDLDRRPDPGDYHGWVLGSLDGGGFRPYPRYERDFPRPRNA